MADRFKLRLSKLSWISLVDEPAQQSAKVLLVKRAGNPDEVTVNANARIVKVAGTDDSPLVYAWAFTVTDDKGQPFTDLQGDQIQDDFIKAAEEYVASGAPVDEMHQEQQTGRLAFAFPMNPSIAGAFLGKGIGDQVKTSGLMVAVRPSAEALAKIRSGEYRGLSIGGVGIREPIGKGTKKPKRAVRPMRGRYGKQTVLTSVEDGHQHGLDVRQVCDRWYSGLTTSYATSDGAEDGHCHAWVFDRETGAITIAMDSGHTHTVDAVVPPDVLAAFAAQEAKPPTDDCDAKPCAVADPPSGPTVLAISMRAPRGDSSPSATAPTVKSKETNAMPDAKDNQIAELEKRNARLEKLATLSDAQRAHFGKLSGSEADAFLAKSAHERDVVLADIEKANEVVYTSPVDGSVYRKNDDRRLIEMAKRNDETTAALRAETIAKREAEFAKKGDEVLTHVAKGLKGDLRGRIMKALNTEFTDPKEYEEAVTAIKGLNFAAANLSKATGVNPQVDPTRAESPQGQLDALVAKHAQEKNVPIAKAYAAVLATAEGAALYKQLPVGRA